MPSCTGILTKTKIINNSRRCDITPSPPPPPPLLAALPIRCEHSGSTCVHLRLIIIFIAAFSSVSPASHSVLGLDYHYLARVTTVREGTNLRPGMEFCWSSLQFAIIVYNIFFKYGIIPQFHTSPTPQIIAYRTVIFHHSVPHCQERGTAGTGPGERRESK